MDKQVRISWLILTALLGLSQHPHGPELRDDCRACHVSDSWEIPPSRWLIADETGPSFRHDATGFVLEGQHQQTDCRACHASLVFAEAEAACITCHTDMHRMTVGEDCARCHQTFNWLVDDVTALHQENGFPLLGAHTLTDCVDCHISASQLEFPRIGNACINCHQTDYAATSMPDHEAAGYSTQCTDCHSGAAFDWSAGSIVHDFFPLTGGHALTDCRQCHTTDNYADTSPECVSCHLEAYQTAQNPDHQAAGFPTNCNLCHTTAPGWSPASINQHDDLYFPIYRGNHRGEWNACTDCHTNPSDYRVFSCTDCHEHNDAQALARDHRDVSGYVFQSSACYACHPQGEE